MSAHPSASTARSGSSGSSGSTGSTGSTASEGPALTIGAAARRLGVAAETLRSWERRYGLGPGARSPGVHRRYTAADLAQLDRFCRLVGEGVASADAAAAVLSGDPQSGALPGSVDSEAASAGAGAYAGTSAGASAGDTPARSARGLARCAIRMDTAQVLALLEEAIARDGVIAAWEGTIEPALLAVGRKWSETQGRYVEVEHLISWCISAALHRMRMPDPAPGAAERIGRRRVLLACAPNEWHCLPMEVLRVALLERGVPVCMLGAAVPPEALQAAVRRVDPARVIVWSQVPATGDLGALPRLPDPAASGARVIAAGPGWSSARSKGIRVLGSLTEAVAACDPDAVVGPGAAHAEAGRSGS
jgi:DNA-binding transcriptional MerR regulator